MSKDGIASHLIRIFFSQKREITKTRKKSKNFVVSKFRVFAIIFFDFPLSAESEWGLGA